MKRACSRFILALTVLAASTGVRGQIRIIQYGQALDANPYIGSGGYNSVANPSRPFDTQLIVNRQVSGLAGFRGTVGYYPVDQLHLRLPSDSLEAFQRQSVGALDVFRGPVYAPTPYYDPARTIPTLRSISSGWVDSGGMALPSLPPAGLTGQAGTAYTPFTLTPQTGAGVRGLRAADNMLFVRSDGNDRYSNMGRTNLFAVSDTAQREQLARELNQVPMPSDLIVRSEVNTRVDTSAGAAGRVPGRGGEPNEPNAAPGAMPPLGPRGQTLSPDQDVFSDILTRLRGTVGGSEPSPPWQNPPEPQGEANAPSGPSWEVQARQPPLLRYPAAEDQEGASSVLGGRGKLVEYSPQKGLVLHGLAGIGRDQFNTIMASAEKFLKEGKFYDAAGAYREAAALNPSNPLPRVGLSLSLFEAGESLGSAHQLRRAAEIFPPVLTSRLEVANMTDVDLIRRRLDFLETRLANSTLGPEPMLYFIAAFLHANLDQTDQAKEYAAKLQASGVEDLVLADYARFLLTGKATSAPASQPTTTPTGAEVK